MNFTITIAGKIIQFDIPDEYSKNFNHKNYKDFLTTSENFDARLKVTEIFFEQKNCKDIQLDRPIQANCVNNPILNCPIPFERYERREQKEFVSFDYLKQLVILNPDEMFLDVYFLETEYAVDLIESKLFLLLTILFSTEVSMMIHGAGFSISGGAGAIIGPNLAGKSTAASLIEYDILLSDDKLAITDIATIPILHATPIGGKTDGKNHALLKAIFLLKKSKDFSIRKINPRDALSRFFVEHWDYIGKLFKPYVINIFQNAYSLFQKVPVYELSFSKEYINNDEIRRILS